MKTVLENRITETYLKNRIYMKINLLLLESSKVEKPEIVQRNILKIH